MSKDADTHSTYWKDRQAQAQSKLTKKTVKETEAQLIKYYRKAMDDVINEFEFTYLKLLNGKQEGINPTPADLYKLDKYWEMQGQITETLNKLGDKQSRFLRKMFMRHYGDIYNSISIDGAYSGGFKHIDKKAVEQIINQIWCADGETWSNRVWDNTEKLRNALNEGLVSCVATGATTEDLKKQLVYMFNVSYSRADSLVKTELAHIQTQAAADRYKDAGIKEYQVWADEDERRCEVCGKLHKKTYLVGETPPIPAHTNCRCTIIPIVE
jgi:SPP1 gp7 family putative phage head morphogenesis protein